MKTTAACFSRVAGNPHARFRGSLDVVARGLHMPRRGEIRGRSTPKRFTTTRCIGDRSMWEVFPTRRRKFSWDYARLKPGFWRRNQRKSRGSSNFLKRSFCGFRQFDRRGKKSERSRCARTRRARLLSGEEMTAHDPFFCRSRGRLRVRSFHFMLTCGLPEHVETLYG